MKLLIIAGPYEADRIRRAALSAGFEAVAVEPGESLSGWITASRPELIVMAPQIVNPDPALALAKVRAVPRGRVPIFLVGEAADEARLRELADGFFIRPIAPELLLERARAILTPAEGDVRRRKNSSLDLERTELGLAPAGHVVTTGAGSAPEAMTRPSKSGGHPARPVGATLQPLVAAALGGAPIAPVRSKGEASSLLAELGAGLDALLDADLDAELDAALARAPAGFPGETTKKVAAEMLVPAAKKVDPNPTGAARARLLAWYAPVEEGDYFQVLGVARDAGAVELRRAYDEIARETAPEVLEPAVAGELSAEIDAIRAVAAEALRVLGDEGLRSRYARHLAPAGSISAK